MGSKKYDASVMWYQVPGVETIWVKDQVRGPQLFLNSEMHTPQAPCFSHPSGKKVARAFSHLALQISSGHQDQGE